MAELPPKQAQELFADGQGTTSLHRRGFTMADLTPLFRQYVAVFQEGADVVKQAGVRRPELEFRLQDTFVQECSVLFKRIMELRKVLRAAKMPYFADLDMTEAAKDEFDTEIRLQLQQYVTKYRSLEKYERERQQLIQDRIISSRGNVVRQLLHGTPDVVAGFHTTNNEFRSGILQAIGVWISVTSSNFSSMQQLRLKSQKKLEDYNIDASFTPKEDLAGEEVNVTVSQSPLLENTQEEVKHYEETISKLTQEQIQLLETEHEELLSHKRDQMKKVEKISSSIMDIVTIQNELASHLQLQSQNINSILDNQDDIEINIKEGNKQLRKANKSSSRTAKMTTYMAIIIGILVLFLDYIG